MYTSSEDAMEANEAITYEMAKRELAKHGFRSRLYDNQLQGEMAFGDGSYTWEPIECTTKGVLEWLGY